VLPKDIQWHLIGHLQTNKVKYIAPFVHLIHSVDSLKLLREIDKQARKNQRSIDCLLQVHIAEEETKFGLSYAEAEELMRSDELAGLHHIRIMGLMGMATFTEDPAQIRQEFRQLKAFFDRMQRNEYAPQVQLRELSMGMSGDYLIAAEEGSTMVRVGSLIFGARG
jgi:PLP dependent protein